MKRVLSIGVLLIWALIIVVSIILAPIIGDDYARGKQLHSIGAYKWAMPFVQKAAERGHAKAQILIGTMYMKGEGVDIKEDIGTAWIEKAAEQGDINAQLLRGQLYIRSNPRDDEMYRKAFPWLEKAAMQGETTAQYLLGYMYLSPRGISQDKVKAIYWYQQGAQRGDILSKQALEELTLDNGERVEGKRVSTGSRYAAFIDSSGVLWVWGGVNKYWGKETEMMGIGTRPVPITTGVKVLAPQLDFYSIMFIRKDGSLWGWGESGHGQLGSISTSHILEPVHIMSSVRSVVGNNHRVFVTKQDGSLWVWGEAGYQRGDRIKKDLATPRKIMNQVKLVSPSSTHTLVLLEDGSLWAWGYNFCGALGDGTKKSRYYPEKVNLKNLKGRQIISIANNEGASYAVTEDGLAWTWGEPHATIPQCSDKLVLIPAQIEGISNAREIIADGDRAMILTEEGNVQYIGSDYMPKKRSAKELERPVITEVKEISFCEGHEIFLKKDGTVWVRGSNDFAQYGDGTHQFSRKPKPVIFKTTDRPH